MRTDWPELNTALDARNAAQRHYRDPRCDGISDSDVGHARVCPRLSQCDVQAHATAAKANSNCAAESRCGRKRSVHPLDSNQARGGTPTECENAIGGINALGSRRLRTTREDQNQCGQQALHDRRAFRQKSAHSWRCSTMRATRDIGDVDFIPPNCRFSITPN